MLNVMVTRENCLMRDNKISRQLRYLNSCLLFQIKMPEKRAGGSMAMVPVAKKPRGEMVISSFRNKLRLPCICVIAPFVSFRLALRQLRRIFLWRNTSHA